jgi:hypothetical protein
MAIVHPPTLINAYLAAKIPNALPNRFSGSLPFFPVGPTDINALTETFPDAANNVFAVYDRMFRMRRQAFPHINCEQILYYFYKMAGDPEALIETTQVVYDLLGRGDESAEDINKWLKDNPQSRSQPVYFHTFKVYQLEEVRDIIDFGTARTYAGNKMIIDYDYHSTGYSEGSTKYNNTEL